MRNVLWRVLTFPLRFTPLRGRLRLGSRIENWQATARSWYTEKGRPVTVVIPTYGDAGFVADAVKSVRRTTRRGMVRIVVADDASAPEHVARLKTIEGIDELVLGEENVGFAANANRGLRAADPAHDVVLLNADTIALPRWLECLQYAAWSTDDVGIVGAQAAVPRWAHPARRRAPQSRRPRVVRPSLPLQARRSRAGQRQRQRAGRDRRVHVRQA